MMTMTPDLLGIHALAAVLRAIPQGRAWEHVERDVAVVLGKDAGAVPWRTVINDALNQQVLVLDETGWHGGPDLGDRHLAPPPRCAAEVDDLHSGSEQFEFLIEVDQLERRA